MTVFAFDRCLVGAAHLCCTTAHSRAERAALQGWAVRKEHGTSPSRKYPWSGCPVPAEEAEYAGCSLPISPDAVILLVLQELYLPTARDLGMGLMGDVCCPGEKGNLRSPPA